MNKYLEKIAEIAEQNPISSHVRNAIGASLAGSVGGVVGSIYANSQLDRRGSATRSTIKSYLRENKLRGKVRIHASSRSMGRRGLYGTSDSFGPHLANKDLLMGMARKDPFSRLRPNLFKNIDKEKAEFHVNMAGAKNKDILLHELGHSKLHSSMKKVPGLLKTYQIGRFIGRPSGAIGIGTFAAATQADSDAKSKGYATLGVASQLPTLLDEGYASGSAIKHVLKKQGLKAAVKSSKVLLPAYATYLGSAAPALAGAYFGAKAGKARREALKKNAS